MAGNGRQSAALPISRGLTRQDGALLMRTVKVRILPREPRPHSTTVNAPPCQGGRYGFKSRCGRAPVVKRTSCQPTKLAVQVRVLVGVRTDRSLSGRAAALQAAARGFESITAHAGFRYRMFRGPSEGLLRGSTPRGSTAVWPSGIGARLQNASPGFNSLCCLHGS